jgi:GNAT superfamily N-acetyltransferase
MTESFTIRPITSDDAATIIAHRRGMFADMGRGNLEAMSAEFAKWLDRKLAAGDYLGWFAITPDGQVAAGLGLWLMEWPAQPDDTHERRAYILNVYTQPAYRRHGLARQLMITAIDWCRANGLRTVLLHASQFGRPLYEELEFKATNEMRLMLAE